MAGAFLECWVVMETVKAFLNRGKKPEVYFWRSGEGLEVDVLTRRRSTVKTNRKPYPSSDAP